MLELRSQFTREFNCPGRVAMDTNRFATHIDVLAFDYRGFGASMGGPRQRVDFGAQLEDYRAAMAAAGSLPGVDRRRDHDLTAFFADQRR